MPGNILCSPWGGERVLVCHPHHVKFGSLQDLSTEINTAVYCRHPLCVCEIPTAILFPHLRVWMCWLPAGQWCGLRPSVLGQDRSETRKIRSWSWSCMLWSWSWSWSWSGYFGLGLASSDLGLRLKNLVLFTSLLWGKTSLEHWYSFQLEPSCRQSVTQKSNQTGTSSVSLSPWPLDQGCWFLWASSW